MAIKIEMFRTKTFRSVNQTDTCAFQLEGTLACDGVREDDPRSYRAAVVIATGRAILVGLLILLAACGSGSGDDTMPASSASEPAQSSQATSSNNRRIRNTLSNAVSQLSPIEMEMDVSAMPAAIVEQMKQTRADSAAQLQKQLPEDVFAALQARAAELREREKLLVAERLKLAHR